MTPDHLSESSKELWDAVLRDYALEHHHLAVLQTALEARDRMLQAQAILDREGVTYIDKAGYPRKHPACAVEIDNRLAWLRALRELNLEGEPAPEARVPRIA
jgi:P27 family predicted phage terminase small subunit